MSSDLINYPHFFLSHRLRWIVLMREAEIQFCNPSNQSYQFQLCQITSKVIFHIGTRIVEQEPAAGPGNLFDEASLSSAAQLKANKVDQKTDFSYYFKSGS